jgi:hypothetical protein
MGIFDIFKKKPKSAAENKDAKQKEEPAPEQSGEFLCDMCGARFNTKPELTDHKEEDHGQGEDTTDRDDSTPDTSGQFLCDQCGARFDSMSALTDHKEEDHGQE